jgi:hypothetical protein
MAAEMNGVRGADDALHQIWLAGMCWLEQEAAVCGIEGED